MFPESPGYAGWGGFVHGWIRFLNNLVCPSYAPLQLGEGGIPVREEHAQMSRRIYPETHV